MNVMKCTSILATATLLLSGCNMGPSYQEPKPSSPVSFSTGATTQPAMGSTTQPASGSTLTVPTDLSLWWHSLNDKELDSLIERAVKSNFDVQTSLTRLQEARATEFVISGGTLPYLGAGGGVGRGSGTNSTKGRVSAPLNAGTNTAGLHEITQVAGFDAGWEIDLFGRFRNQLEAAAADTQAAAEARNVVLISVVAEVARAYIEVRTAQKRLEIAQGSISDAQQTLNLVSERYRLGLTNELDVVLARRQISTVQASVAPLSEAIRRGQRRVAVLIGCSPEALYQELSTAATFPLPPVSVVTGLPIDLLRRRPDIRLAERRIASETARIGVATADLFPRVMLTAGLGLEGQGFDRSPSHNSFIWSAGPSVYMPLFDFGRIDSQIMLEDFRTQEMFLKYQQTVVNAVQEVDDSVDGYDAIRNRVENIQGALEASQRAVALASGRYERGLIDFLNVLDAQRQLFDLEDQYTVAKEAMVVQYISVYKSLGGGWESMQDIPSLRNPRPALLSAGSHVLGQQNDTSTDEATKPISHSN